MQERANTFTIREAAREDTGLILTLIRELAAYEKMLDDVIATEALLEAWLFDRGTARALIAEEAGAPVGFALYFFNFSTFLGRGGLYLEDLYIRPEYRGRGYGKRLFIKLAAIAKAEGCGRFEWWCLDWNTPSIDFYRAMGAKPMDEWTVYRIDGQTLTDLAARHTPE